MQIVLEKLRTHLAKGPLIEFFTDGKVIRLDQGVPKHVDDKYAHQLLEKYPDLIKKIPRQAVAKPKGNMLNKSKNKMVNQYKDKVKKLNEEEDGSKLERPSS